MPVLSETTASMSLPGLDLPYVFIGGFLLLVLGVLISRRSKKSPTQNTSLPQLSEKSPQEASTYSPPMTFPQHQHHGHVHPTMLSRPPQPLPFTPPTLSTTIFPAPLSPTGSFSQPSSPGSGLGLNQSYYDSPTTLEFEFPYSTTPYPTSEPAVLSTPRNPTSTSGSGSGSETDLPRRRSYTKTHSTSSNSSVTVSGEVIAAEGWRRHTRVFGGGVCKACEESERRMAA
jgi:hypothetical protein